MTSEPNLATAPSITQEGQRGESRRLCSRKMPSSRVHGSDVTTLAMIAVLVVHSCLYYEVHCLKF
eukprot:6180847-Pleurochrysis_carterae.AAC.2